MIESKLTSHRFWPARTTIVGSKQKRLLRISNELSTLTTSLPKGIFLRVDTERVDVMKALIIGPKGTPYEGGCFIFDIVLPPNYPVEVRAANNETLAKKTVPRQGGMQI